jgi:tRNA(fMet)-specific endonuclease VapC
VLAVNKSAEIILNSCVAYLVDSDWIIDHLNHVAEATELLGSLSSAPVYISIISYMEVYQGTLKAEDPANALPELQDFIIEAPIIPFSEAVARRCALLREVLRMQSKQPNRRAYDLIIAATALEHDLTLVTRNVRDYSDIPDLRLHTAVGDK